MTANWETFALSLSVGRYGQLSASGWKKDSLSCISGKSEPLLNKPCGHPVDGSDATG